MRDLTAADDDIFQKRADLSADAESLFEAEGPHMPGSISADGSTLMFQDYFGSGENRDIGMISSDGDFEPRMLIETESATLYPSDDDPDREITSGSVCGGQSTTATIFRPCSG